MERRRAGGTRRRDRGLRALAHAESLQQGDALSLVDELADEPALRTYHLLPAVRADLLMQLGRHEEARAELERAAYLTANTRERELLLARARG